MKLLASHNILSGPAVLRVPAGQYAGFVLRTSGTNQAAQSLTAANHGLVTAQYRGRTFLSVEFDDLQDIDNLIGGVVEESTTAGAAFRMTAFLPASFYNDGNVFDVSETDNFFVNLDLAGVTGTIVVSGTLELYGILQEGVQKYMPTIQTQTPTISANGRYPIPSSFENVTHVFVQDLANVSRLHIDVDGKNIIEGSQAAVLAFSNFAWGIETALTDFLGVALAPSANLGGALSDNVNIEITAGAADSTPNVIVCGIDPTPDNLARSKSSVTASTNAKLARKTSLGKTRAVQVARMLRPITGGQ